MNTIDFFILVIFLACVLFCLFKIVNAFNDEFTVTFESGHLNEQLERLNLQNIIGVGFKFDKRYEFDKLKQLSISISNKSSTHSVYVDWDYSTLTDLDKRARRVTRLMPGTTLDLFQAQVFSAIAPGTTLKENLTAEDILKRKGPDAAAAPIALEMQIAKPLLDIPGLNHPKAPDVAKRRYRRFMRRLDPLSFSLNLVVRLVGSDFPTGRDRAHLECNFTLTKLPWTAGLPWNPKD